MDIPANILERISHQKSAAPRCPRDEMLDNILPRINASRISDGFKPLTYGWLVRRVKGISDQNLYALHRECENARSYSALFWFKTNTKKA